MRKSLEDIMDSVDENESGEEKFPTGEWIEVPPGTKVKHPLDK